MAEVDATVDRLPRRIADPDRRFAGLAEDDPALGDRVGILIPVPGVGATVLATLLAELPELGPPCHRRIAALAGLAPHARESGT